MTLLCPDPLLHLSLAIPYHDFDVLPSCLLAPPFFENYTGHCACYFMCIFCFTYSLLRGYTNIWIYGDMGGIVPVSLQGYHIHPSLSQLTVMTRSLCSVSILILVRLSHIVRCKVSLSRFSIYDPTTPHISERIGAPLKTRL